MTSARAAGAAASGEAEDREPSILVVDDVAMFRELETLFLARLGRVRAAEGVAEARAAIAERTPDVLVLDWSLRDGTAEELVSALRGRPDGGWTNVVAVTGGRAHDHERAVRAGAADVVTKPLSRRVLVESVRRVLQPAQPPRALPRIAVATPVRIWNPQRAVWGLARNLSRGGMFIESEWLPPAATELQLAFRLGDEPASSLEPSACLVWRRLRPSDGAAGIGVRFLGVDGETWRRLDAYVHERLGADAEGPAPAEGPRSRSGDDSSGAHG